MEANLRITADDSDFSAKVLRLGSMMREAFNASNLEGITSVLDEADKKFSNLEQKLSYIRKQLLEQRAANTSGLREEISEIFGGQGTSAQKQTLAAVARTTTGEQQQEIDRLIRALNNLENAVNKDAENQEQPEEGGGKKGRTSYLKVLQDLMRGNVGGAIHGSVEGAGSSFLSGESLVTFLEVLGGVTAALVGLGKAISMGNEDLRSEIDLNRRFLGAGSGLEDAAQLGMSRSEYREALIKNAYSLRSGRNIDAITTGRTKLGNALGLSSEEIQSLDKYYNTYVNGRTSDRSGLSPDQAMLEILQRSSETGILGVNKDDFTKLPEKIAQVSGIVAMQFRQSEQTNMNEAINMIMAGQHIGGRFADNRAADTFAKLNQGITSPQSPGMRAFIYEALHRANPNLSYVELLAQQQKGLTAENAGAIFPLIQGIQNRDLRALFLERNFLQGDYESSLRLAGAGNLGAFVQGLRRPTISGGEQRTLEDQVSQRNREVILLTDQFFKDLKNGFTGLFEDLSKNIQKLLAPSGPQDRNTPGVVTPIFNSPRLKPGSPTGSQASKLVH